MKNLLLTLASASIFLVTSCKKDETNVAPEKKDTLIVEKEKIVEPDLYPELYGLYTGEFSGKMKNPIGDYDTEEYQDYDYKKITLKINRITKDSVYGHSIVNGNQRPFQGTYNNNTKSFVLDEPGTDKTDGRFEVKIKGDSVMGSWAAYKKADVNADKKELKLLKKDFVYNPNFMLDENSSLIDWSNPKVFKEKYTNEDGSTDSYTVEKNRFASDAVFKLNASKQKLTEKELKNLRKLDLEIIKNAVYARHGYSFKKETFRNFFQQTDWYIPVSPNVENDLSPLEKENVQLLSKFIKYAEDKYDQFGR